MLDQFSKIVLALNQACREQPMDKFQRTAFEIISSAIPLDSGFWFSGSMNFDTPSFHSNIHFLYNQPESFVVDWAKVASEEGIPFTKKVFGLSGVTQNGTANEFTPKVAQCSRQYRVEHVLATNTIDPVTSLNELISIYRSDSNSPFTEAERQFQQSLVPHLVETWRTNRLLHLAYAHKRQVSSQGFSAAADNKGLLHLAEPGFTKLLQEEWPGWSGPKLPASLVSEIENGRKRFLGNGIAVQIEFVHNQYLLGSRRKSAVDTLTPREQEIAGFFATGHSNKEIAHATTLSPSTVRNHISAIYSKLRIGSKAELANLLKEYA